MVENSTVDGMRSPARRRCAPRPGHPGRGSW
jgi:hypothetical protein